MLLKDKNLFHLYHGMVAINATPIFTNVMKYFFFSFISFVNCYTYIENNLKKERYADETVARVEGM